MNKKMAKAALLLGGFVLAATGCRSEENVPEEAQSQYQEEQRAESVRQKSGNDTEVSAFYETEENAGIGEKEDTEEPEEIVYVVQDVSGIIKTEAETDRTAEDTWSSPVTDGMPADTVEYVPSSEEEIMETVYEESTVDENDPDTYRIVEREQEVSVILETPAEYTDGSGKVKYEFRDGVWHEYSYSTGEVVLDSQDEELALLLLNMDGSYDDYELMEIACNPIEEEGNAAEYSYQVLYRKTEVLDGEPADVENLAVTRTIQTQSVEKQTVQEKVPVMVSREEGTGEFRYFGWQQEAEGTCYYDKNGDRITGYQVIQGIRYQFDENGFLVSHAGVDVSSRNGEVDWNRVRNTGMEFAMIRGGYRGAASGSLILDGEAERNLELAAAAGLKTGVYIFSQAVTEQEAVEEASLAVSLARKYGVSLPVALKLDFSGPSYAGRADGLSAEDRTKIANAFCTTVRNAGYEPMIFAGESWIANSMTRPENVKVWFAADGADHAGMEDCAVWQYTAMGTLDGITGNAGLNMSCGMQL